MAALQVRVIPRAGRTAIAGRRGDALLIRLAAAPVEGAANEALIDLLSDTLAVPRRSISIAAGRRSRDKRIEIDGLDPDTLERRLSAILGRG